MYYAHYKNVEKAAMNGKFDPTAGLSSSGIAGTGLDKDEEENSTALKANNTDEEMKDISKKDNGMLFCFPFNILVKWLGHLTHIALTTL